MGTVDTILARRSADSGVAIVEPRQGTAAGILAAEPAPECMRCYYLLVSNGAAQRANQIYRKPKNTNLLLQCGSTRFLRVSLVELLMM